MIWDDRVRSKGDTNLRLVLRNKTPIWHLTTSGDETLIHEFVICKISCLVYIFQEKASLIKITKRDTLKNLLGANGVIIYLIQELNLSIL